MYKGNLARFALMDIFPSSFTKNVGLCVLCSATAHQQAYLGAVYGEPRAVHEEEEARHHRGAADEGPGQGGEEQEAD